MSALYTDQTESFVARQEARLRLARARAEPPVVTVRHACGHYSQYDQRERVGYASDLCPECEDLPLVCLPYLRANHDLWMVAEGLLVVAALAALVVVLGVLR